MKKLFALAIAATAIFAQAQTFPGTKPISLAVPFAPGGPTDLVARGLAEAMRKAMGGMKPEQLEQLEQQALAKLRRAAQECKHAFKA